MTEPLPSASPGARPTGAAMSALLPAGVAVVETYGDLPGATLLPGEGAAVARAVGSRRAEYATVRHCARRALAELGLPPAPILSGPKREPLWPAGVRGSLTHCAGYRAAALAHEDAIGSLGIDAEPHGPLTEGVFDLVTRPDERAGLDACAQAHPAIHWGRLLFSAKESVYKAWFPLTGSWLGFEDASLSFHLEEGAGAAGTGPALLTAAGSFTVGLHVPAPGAGAPPLPAMSGRWRITGGLILTATVVPAP